MPTKPQGMPDSVWAIYVKADTMRTLIDDTARIVERLKRDKDSDPAQIKEFTSMLKRKWAESEKLFEDYEKAFERWQKSQDN